MLRLGRCSLSVQIWSYCSTNNTNRSCVSLRYSFSNWHFLLDNLHSFVHASLQLAIGLIITQWSCSMLHTCNIDVSHTNFHDSRRCWCQLGHNCYQQTSTTTYWTLYLWCASCCVKMLHFQVVAMLVLHTVGCCFMILFLTMMVSELEYQTRPCVAVEKWKNLWNMFCCVVVRIVRMKKQELWCWIVYQILSSHSAKWIKKLDITKSLLLAPCSQSNHLSQRENIHCKKMLFDFTASTDKRI